MRRFILFCFHHFYHSFAWTYDFVARIVSVGRWQDWGRMTLAHVRGPRVLEIGFGPGHLQLALNQQGLRAFGLDESRQMIRQAHAALRRARQPVRLVRGYAQVLPYASASFDCVLSTFPSEYIADTRTLAELLRVLKPGGRVVVLPVAGMHSASSIDRFASWLFRVTGQPAQVTYSLEMRYADLFQKNGFEVRVLREEIRQSTVMIVLARKPGPDQLRQGLAGIFEPV